MTLTTILVRHGESSWNRRGLMQGQTDSPALTTAGRAQAEQVAASLVGRGVDLVLTSDLRRARQTAKVISSLLSVPLSIEPRLRERNLGSAQGRPASPVMLATLGIVDELVQDPDRAPAGGETVAAFFERVTALLVELCQQHPEGTIVLVTHGGVVRVAKHCVQVGGLGIRTPGLYGMPWPEVDNGSSWSASWLPPGPV